MRFLDCNRPPQVNSTPSKTQSRQDFQSATMRCYSGDHRSTPFHHQGESQQHHTRFQVRYGTQPIPDQALPWTDYEVRHYDGIGVSVGQWFWQVVAIHSLGATTFGDVWTFTVTTAGR